MVSALQLSDSDFLSLFNIDELSALLEQSRISEAKAFLIDHFGRRVEQSWLDPPEIITDMRVKLSDLSRKQLIARADAILDFRLSPENTPPRIFSNGKIDWCFNPISSPEWLWRLNRHQWWNILGKAFICTGDERYAEAFVAQMLDWVDKNPPPDIKNEKSPTWRLMEAGMRMQISWLPSFALFLNHDVLQMPPNW
jgi:hypothetical protein